MLLPARKPSAGTAAWPVRTLLGGEDSPAALFLEIRSQRSVVGHTSHRNRSPGNRRRFSCSLLRLLHSLAEPAKLALITLDRRGQTHQTLVRSHRLLIL